MATKAGDVVPSNTHFDTEAKARAREARGVRIAKQSRYLRHFTAELRWA